MENRIEKTKIKRFLAFIFDVAFITFLAFTLYMLLGLIFKIDSEGYQNIVIYPLLIIIISYLFLGESIFTNTFGKYLLGIKVVDNEKLERPSLLSFIERGLLKVIWPVEGLVLLFSKSQKRLGDSWAKTIVINKLTNKFKPSARFIIAIVTLIVLLFSFRISMGFAAKKTDFYNIGVSYLKNIWPVEIVGLPKEVNQNRNTVYFTVPISNENQDKYAIIYLEKFGNKWSFNHVDFTKNHIIGFSYGFSNSSSNQNETKVINHLSVGKITWSGNIVYTSDRLNKVLGLETGDNYDPVDIKKRLNNNVSLLYLDNGYAFYQANFVENQNINNKVDLTISIYEGLRAKIGEITVKGNITVPNSDILKKIELKPSDFFSKTKIINSVRGIASTGKFDPEKISPYPTLNKEKSTQDYAIIDIVFEVSEKNKK